MSETDKLRNKLSKLAEADAGIPGHEREVRAADSYDCLTKILDEIEEIVLPRDLMLRNAAGQTLSLTVKNRRLIRLNSPVTQSLAGFINVFDQELSASDSGQMVDLANVFATFCVYGSVISVETAKAASGDHLDEIGVAVEQIHHAATAHPDFKAPVDEADLMQIICNRSGGHCLAWIRLNNEGVVSSDGSEAHLGRLHVIFENALPYVSRHTQTANREVSVPQYWVFGARIASPVRTAIAIVGADTMLALMPAEFATKWIDICHRATKKPAV